MIAVLMTALYTDTETVFHKDLTECPECGESRYELGTQVARKDLSTSSRTKVETNVFK